MTTAPGWVWFLEFAASTTSFAAHWLLQSTLVIGIGLIAARVLGGGGPALRSVIYRTTLVAVWLCPLVAKSLAFAGLTLGVGVLPEVRVTELDTQPVSATAHQALHAGSDRPLGTFEPGNTVSQESANQAVAALLGSIDPNTADEPFNDLREAPTAQGEPAAASSSTASIVAAAQETFPTWVVRPVAAVPAIVALLAWLLGIIILLASLLIAHVRLQRLRRVSVLAAEDLQELCCELSAKVGLAPPVVLTSPFMSGPCLSGIWRPAILLPDDLPELVLSDIFIHELAHLRRRDCQWNLLRQISAAVLFFQPLIWRLSHQLETTAEEVCDDYVVKHGADRDTYADTLVSLAEWSRVPIASAVVPLVALRSMLGHRVTRILDRTRKLSLSVNLTAWCLVIGAGLTATLFAGALSPVKRRADVDSQTQRHLPEESASSSAPNDNTFADSTLGTTPPQDSEERINSIHGYVVDPSGQQVVGAEVVFVRFQPTDVQGSRAEPHSTLARTKTDRSGRFSISFRESDLDDSGRAIAPQAMIVATAPGFGPAWIKHEETTPGPNNVLRLVDDKPIAGRVIDSEGQPVRGVSVRLESIRANKTEDLTNWLASLDKGKEPSRSGLVAAVPAIANWPAPVNFPDSLAPGRMLPAAIALPHREVVSDADGNFSLTGAGCDRLATLRLSGVGIATAQLQVAVRSMAPLPIGGNSTATLYGANLTYVVDRSTPVQGVVRDAQTHEPLAGVRIVGYRAAGARHSGGPIAESATDAAGNFTLQGLSPREDHKLVAVPAVDQPYLIGDLMVPAADGQPSALLDIQLQRGIWITGRISDKNTGAAVRATVTYLPLPDNGFADHTLLVDIARHRWLTPAQHTNPDGRYQIVGLPGHGIVEVKCSMEHAYLQGQILSDQVDRTAYDETDLADMLAPSQLAATAIKEIHPQTGTHNFQADVALESGLQIPLELVDPEGRSLAGVKAYGLWPTARTRQLGETGPSALVVGLRQNEQRLVLLHHAERNLGQALRLSTDAGQLGPRRVLLERCARVQGRLVDDDGQPLSEAMIQLEILGQGEIGGRYWAAKTDADGQFFCPMVLPGCNYNIVCQSAQLPRFEIAHALAAPPGATIDLGEVHVTSAPPTGERTRSVSSLTDAVPAADVATTQF